MICIVNLYYFENYNCFNLFHTPYSSYVLLCEADTHSVLTLHTKNEEGAYSRRTCSSRPTIVAPNLLPHLYGQLAQTANGLEHLQRHGDLSQLYERLLYLSTTLCSSNGGTAAASADDSTTTTAQTAPSGSNNNTTEFEDVTAVQDQRREMQCLEMKATIWALCHVCTSPAGLQHMCSLDGGRFVRRIIKLCQHSGVYSVRATAFHALSLVASTKTGADLLYTLDWMCVRHDRDTHWPICEPEDWMSKHMTVAALATLSMRHALDAVPPYNYAGMQDDLSVTATVDAIDLNGVACEPELKMSHASETHADLNMPQLVAANRFKTLPDGSSRAPNATTVAAGAVYKHHRSLSESKTTEGLVGANTPTVHLQRTRFNSGTDSNTSGVSSCESVYGGRFAMISDLHAHTKTLSPIPSTSNLLDVKAGHNAASADGNGRIRRISLTGASFRENTLSPQDAQGYAALRRLRSAQRPMFSESAADDLTDYIELSTSATMSTISASMTMALSSAATARNLKVRSLDRRSDLAAVGGASTAYQMQCRARTQSCDSTATTATGSVRFGADATATSGPCYTGRIFLFRPFSFISIFLLTRLHRNYKLFPRYLFAEKHSRPLPHDRSGRCWRLVHRTVCQPGRTLCRPHLFTNSTNTKCDRTQ